MSTNQYLPANSWIILADLKIFIGLFDDVSTLSSFKNGLIDHLCMQVLQPISTF